MSATTEAPAAAPAVKRQFFFNSHELEDRYPAMTPEQVRDVWVGTFPGLQNAKIKGPDKAKDAEGNEVKKYTFVQNVGNLG